MEHLWLEAFSEDMKQRLRSATFIKNVCIFDGRSDSLTPGQDVIVEGNIIRKILPSGAAEREIRKHISGAVPDEVFATAIDAGGKTLMPGLIDVHNHITIVAAPGKLINDRNWMWAAAASAREAERMLMRGFTTLRDVGGAALGLGQAIDEGMSTGPRIIASGPIISQTAGHGDFRVYNQDHPNMPGGTPGFLLKEYSFLADSPDEVRRCAREVLRRGAPFVKMMVGGGAASQYDPLHTVQFTVDEMRAGVQAAWDWGTYVSVHAYNDTSIRRALEVGVISIEHGTLMNEDTMKMIRDNDAWLVPQARLFMISEAEEAFFKSLGPASLAKARQLQDHMRGCMEHAVKHQVKIAFGTDLFGNPQAFAKQPEDLTARLTWFSAAQVLKQATSEAARLLSESGELMPYKAGSLGVIAEECYADMLIVDGNPLEEIKLLENHEQNIKLIMKDGQIYKNTL